MSNPAYENLHELLTGDDEGRLCKDIPEAACKEQSGNFSRHLISLASTKTGDGLADPKLVLAWLLGALGAPAAAIGLLVPVRESLALLPQLFTSASIRSMPVRKWAWAGGSAVQGVCVVLMAIVALTLEGAAAGWAIVGLLAVFALARSVCSVSYKDVLGKTVSKQSRGTVTGSASSLAAALVLLFGLLLSIGVIPLDVSAIAIVLFVAGGLWLFAGTVFSQVVEDTGATEGGANGIDTVVSQFSLLRRDPQLALFICVRGLLIATALAPPYLLALAEQTGERDITSLGPFVIASSLASVLSGYIWGRFADRSSRLVLAASGVISAAVLGATGLAFLFDLASGSRIWALAGALFVLMIAYQGVRLGRSTHLVDMADQDTRASYTALSNTAIGVLLLLGGGFGLIADLAGIPAVMAIFAGMCLAAAVLALKLDNAQA